MPSVICQSTSARSAASSTEPSRLNGVTSAVPHPIKRVGVSGIARGVEDVLHRENAAPADQPGGRDERTVGEHPAVARDMLQSHLFELRVENDFVNAGNRPDSHTRDWNLAPPRGGSRLGERECRSYLPVLLSLL